MHTDHNSGIQRLIFAAIQDTQDVLDVHVKEAPQAPLLESDGGPLDSLGVVNLMVAVEGRLAAAFGRSVSLAEALACPPEDSPFRTVADLTAYVERMLSLEPE